MRKPVVLASQLVLAMQDIPALMVSFAPIV
jgi:hypothetical protein